MAIKLRLSGSGTGVLIEVMAYAPVEMINPVTKINFDSIFVFLFLSMLYFTETS